MKKSSRDVNNRYDYTHKSSTNTNSFTRKSSTGSTSSTNNNVDNIMDVPNMEDDNIISTPLSIDVELEATDRYLQKVNEQQRRESLRLSHNSKRELSDTASRSSGSISRSSGRQLSDSSRSSGSRRQSKRNSSVLSQSSIGETALDMPHLDDILRSSAKTMSSADAAAGGGSSSSMGGGSRRSFTSQSSIKSAPTRKSDNRRVSSSTSMLNNNNKSAAIIIEDDESNISWGSTGSRQELSSALRKSETLEFSSNSEQILENELLHSKQPSKALDSSNQRDRRSSLDNKLTTFDSISSARRSLNLGTKQQNKRGSWVFESLWGSQDHEEREDDETSIGELNFGVSLGSSNDEDDENKSMRLIRTISGRVGFSMSNVSFRGNGMQRQHSTYYDTGYKRKCRSFFGEHIKLIALCLLVLVVLAITIGLIPLWMESEERGESGELGGLAYSVEENTKVNTWAGEVVVNRSGGGDGKDQVDEETSNEDNGDVGAAQSSEVPSTTTNEELQKDEPEVPDLDANRADFFKPPPYDLQSICSSSSLSSSDGYDMCIAACLPSRCCLISEEYKVWTIPETWRLQLLYPGVETMGQYEKEAPVIGNTISPCLFEQPGLCREYKTQCSVLPLGVLLPLKPPSKDEVANMSSKERLKLAEYINHSCKKSSKTIEGDNECQLLCQEKACCFADNEKETKAFLPHTEVISISTVPNIDDIDEPQDEVKQESNASVLLDRQPTNTTTESTQASLPLNGTESESNSTLRRLQQKSVETFVNNTEDGKGDKLSPLHMGESSVNTAMAKSSQEESVVELPSCVNDPLEHCMIYAGCLSLFTTEN